MNGPNHRIGRSLSLLLTLTLLSLFVPVVTAQDQPIHPARQRLVQVVAPQAISMIVSDSHNMLVVGIGGAAADQLRVHPISSNGTLAEGDPQTLTLPRPDDMAEVVVQPISMILHPSLPLLYVWQDVAGVDANSDPGKKLQAEFGHISIYRIADGKLELVVNEARGADFALGQRHGGMAIDAAGQRLFVPNVMFGNHAGIGYFDLDQEGMLVPIDVPVEGSLDGYGLEQFEKEIKPRGESTHNFRNLPTAMSAVSFEAGFVTFPSNNAVVTWDTTNRLASFGVFYLPGGAAHNFLVAHPTRQVLYYVPQNGAANLYRIEHALGVPSLVPKAISAPQNLAEPVVIGGNRAALIGVGANVLYVWPLDPRGDLTGTRLDYPLKAANTTALAVSQRRNRVYVAVVEVEP